MTTAIPNKTLRIFLTALILVAAFYPLLSRSANSATLTALSDTMTRLKTSQLSDHVIKFTTPTGVAAAGTITINFNAAGFSTGSTAFGDIDFTHGASTGLETSETLAATPSGATWGAAFATNVLTLTSGSGTVTAGDKVIITIGLQASGGANQITNPGSNGSKSIAITAGSSDSGTVAVAIMTEDQVTVSATVDPSITSSLSASTCSLGTLGVGAINFCSYTNTVNTNASSGYVSTIVENGNLCSPSVAVCTNDIDDAGGDNDVDQGSEEYGVSSNDTTGTQDVVDSTGCDDSGTVENASAITGTAKVYADSGDGDAGPVSNAVTTICHSASVAGTTPAGSYSHIVTHITTGTF
ncbi:MAG TPA: hypothetical protein VLE47_03710 [Candidatus Saccharimonadales bacterium]|nr:hypothetical protein [Candidatus Saccharimonadales bacterium]